MIVAHPSWASVIKVNHSSLVLKATIFGQLYAVGWPTCFEYMNFSGEFRHESLGTLGTRLNWPYFWRQTIILRLWKQYLQSSLRKYMLQPKPEIVNMTNFHDCRTFALFGITDSLLRPLDPIGARISQSWEKVIFWPCDLRFWPRWPQIDFWGPQTP